MKMNPEPQCKNPCKDAFFYTNGIKGRNADSTGILFVLNRADSRITQMGLFNHGYMTAILKSKTGETLRELLAFCGLSFDDIYLTNAFKCLLSGDRAPTRKEYQNCASMLEAQIMNFEPEQIVAFGSKVYECMFPIQASENNFENAVGQKLKYKGILTLISNHPCKLGSILSKNRLGHYETIKDFLSV